MPITRKDRENATPGQDQNPLKAPPEGDRGTIPKDSPGGRLRDLPNGDYSAGHPGVPPEGYKPPRESRR